MTQVEQLAAFVVRMKYEDLSEEGRQGSDEADPGGRASIC